MLQRGRLDPVFNVFSSHLQNPAIIYQVSAQHWRLVSTLLCCFRVVSVHALSPPLDNKFQGYGHILLIGKKNQTPLVLRIDCSCILRRPSLRGVGLGGSGTAQETQLLFRGPSLGPKMWEEPRIQGRTGLGGEE